MCHGRKSVFLVWNNMRGSKWWQNSHFWMIYSFNSQLFLPMIFPLFLSHTWALIQCIQAHKLLVRVFVKDAATWSCFVFKWSFLFCCCSKSFYSFLMPSHYFFSPLCFTDLQTNSPKFPPSSLIRQLPALTALSLYYTHA